MDNLNKLQCTLPQKVVLTVSINDRGQSLEKRSLESEPSKQILLRTTVIGERELNDELGSVLR